MGVIDAVYNIGDKVDCSCSIGSPDGEIVLLCGTIESVLGSCKLLTDVGSWKLTSGFVVGGGLSKHTISAVTLPDTGNTGVAISGAASSDTNAVAFQPFSEINGPDFLISACPLILKLPANAVSPGLQVAIEVIDVDPPKTVTVPLA